jgi:hypothetical protein
VNEKTCSICGRQLTQDHCVEDYLAWKCSDQSCPGSDLEHFSEMSDESWEWVKQHMRKPRGNSDA